MQSALINHILIGTYPLYHNYS